MFLFFNKFLVEQKKEGEVGQTRNTRLFSLLLHATNLFALFL